jgi:hypothetical protein
VKSSQDLIDHVRKGRKNAAVILRRLFIVLLILAAALCIAFMAYPQPWYRSLDRIWMATRHLNQRGYYGLGYRLPGPCPAGNYSAVDTG